MEGSLKNLTFKGGRGSPRKTNIDGRDCFFRGAWTVYWFKGGLAENEGWCFWEKNWDPNAHFAEYLDWILNPENVTGANVPFESAGIEIN